MSEHTDRLSDAVVHRLPGYYRHLREMEREGIRQVSSTELGRRMGQTPSLVRQDLNSIGGFGRQGYGYDVTVLKNGIGNVLGLNHSHTMIILGAGSIGSAVARYPNFLAEGFTTLAMFDTDPAKVGNRVGDLTVQSMEQLGVFLTSRKADIAVLAVPAYAAKETAEQVVKLGVHAVWNFAPVDLDFEKDDVTVVNVHLSESLQVLSYLLEQKEKGAGS